MPNDSIRHRPFRTHAKPQSQEKSREVKARSTPVEFLIDSGILPLVLIGKGVRCFGWAAVLAFTFGVLSLWGYAAVTKTVPLVELKLPPALPTPTPVQPTKMVRLSGVVRDGKRQPITEPFWVGVLANQQGPVQDAEGSFVLEVPESNNYDVALWTSPESVTFYNRIPAVQDDKGLKLQRPLPFLAPGRPLEITVNRHTNTRPGTENASLIAGQ